MRPFSFGVQSYKATSPDDWRQQARQAEELGYSTFSLADHVIGPGPSWPPPTTPCRTSRRPGDGRRRRGHHTISIGCRVFCADYHHPVMLAKELATLDWFSGGRLEIGIGAGWLQGEYEAMGVTFDPPGRRIDRLVETIALLRACFADGEVDVAGEHVHAVGFEAVPKPPQRPAPPFMIGGGSKRVLGIAGREADIVSLNFDNCSGKIGPAGVGSSTAELTKQKVEWIRAGAGDRFDDLELEIGGYFSSSPTSGRGRSSRWRRCSASTPSSSPSTPTPSSARSTRSASSSRSGGTPTASAT